MDPDMAWNGLVEWLRTLGMQTESDGLLVTRSSIAGDAKFGQGHRMCRYIVSDGLK